MPRIRDVCVIGAGLSGLACALAAAVAGCEVDVFASAPSVAAVADPASQIDIGPHAMRELAALGVGAAAAAAGFAYQGQRFVSERGDPLFEIATPALAGPRLPAALGLRHATLLGLLAEGAERGGARLHAGVRVEAGRHAAAGSTEPALVLSEQRAASADLVVVATGLDSPLRRTIFPEAPPAEDLGQHWWQVLLPRPHAVDRATWVVGPGGRKLLLLPVSVAQAGVALPRPAAALADCGRGVSRGASLRGALAFAAAVLPSLDGRLGDATPVSVRPLRAALLPGPWHRDRVLCVGECAHALPPHFGQAAAQSLEDAVVLGDLLRAGADRAALFAGFTARRATRAARVHALVSQAARWSRRPDIRTDLRALHGELDAVVAAPA